MTAQTISLADFLLARIAEDETLALHRLSGDTSGSFPSPARVLAECEAKRRIVEELAPDSCSSPDAWGQYTSALELLALPYADHEDYREEWRV